MSSPETRGVGTQTDIGKLTLDAVTYGEFRNTVVALHRAQTEGADPDSYDSLNRGLRLLGEWGMLFPGYAAQLADDPTFPSN